MGCRDDPKVNRGEANLGGYCNKKIDEIAAKVLVEPDTAKRDLMIKEAFEIASEGLRIYSVASAGTGVGRIEETEFAAARG